MGNFLISSKFFFEDWDIFVSTPATATKILKEMTNVDYLVIDEADILLDDSFVDVMVDFLNIVKIRYSATNKTENGKFC